MRLSVLAWCILAVGLIHSSELLAQGKYKKLPPPGISIESARIEGLRASLAETRELLQSAKTQTRDSASWESDVEVLLRAVELTIDQNLFFKKSQVDDSKRLIEEAQRRIKAAVRGDRGLVLMGFREDGNGQPQPLVGGFVSRIDDSIQPYGLIVPEGFSLDRKKPARMDVWLHGRGDTKTEVPFIKERMTKVGLYAPKNTFVLHPFGRHCNAFKFAGETDVYESIEHVKSFVEINSKRLAIRGFSMGGAGCWHLAVHNPANWFAANPGAGFVDTLRYQGWTKSTPFEITPTAGKLLHWYDVLPWTSNLRNLNTIAYSGEVDKQKQAADRVVERAGEIGLEFPYVIGEKMGHKVDDASKARIEEQIAAWENKPTSSPKTEIDFVTYTLRYAKADWVRITGMEEHWTPARVNASLKSDGTIQITSSGVTHLELDFSESGWSGADGGANVRIDGSMYFVEDTGNLRGFQCRLTKGPSGQWNQMDRDKELRKRPGLQGPIDDAFCSRFVFVLPSRPARHGRVQRWINRETQYAMRRWEQIMRGEVRTVLDRDLTEEHLNTCNLICFGDFSSNRYLFSIAEQLPINWTRESLSVGDESFEPSKHVPVFCYPNPANPERYLVVNSGMTFREFSNNSNSRQIAMLPDWAILDVTQADDSIYAGGIVQQGFFSEQWTPIRSRPSDLE